MFLFKEDQHDISWLETGLKAVQGITNGLLKKVHVKYCKIVVKFLLFYSLNVLHKAIDLHVYLIFCS